MLNIVVHFFPQVWKFIMTWLQGNKEEVERVFNTSENYEQACIKLLNVLRFPCIGEDKSPLDNNSMLVLQDVFQQQVLDTFLKLYIKESQFARKYHNDPTMYHKQLQDSGANLEIRNPCDVIMAIGGFTSRESASKMTCILPVSELVSDRPKEVFSGTETRITMRELRSRTRQSSEEARGQNEGVSASALAGWLRLYDFCFHLKIKSVRIYLQIEV